MKSSAIDHVIRDTFGNIQSDKLRRMATNCLRNTLDTTIEWEPGDSPFVITGDIPAMWLRDSSCQLEPYIRFIAEDKMLRSLVTGVIHRQVFYINTDAYANAFNRTASGIEAFPEDKTVKNPWVFERKFELDSLCHTVRLWRMYWEVTHDKSLFTEEMYAAILTILDVFETEQDHVKSYYSFERPNCPPTDTLVNQGRGSDVAKTGFIWSGFRPSDDACTYHYLIPSQMFAVVSLNYLQDLVQDGYGNDTHLLERIIRCRNAVQGAIVRHATVSHPTHGDIWAYEVDGLGNSLLMDDPNVPSLLSLPYLGFCGKDNAQYLRTRNFVLSSDNPYFVSGAYGSSVSSPHTPQGYFWPIAVVMQALTSTSAAEVNECIYFLLHTDAGTDYMHESINVNDPEQYTRPWFAWANSLFAELMLRTMGYTEVLIGA